MCENPKTGNWEGHGNHYMTMDFYKQLEGLVDMEIKELGEHPAMGNKKDGWNVYCVFTKKGGEFCSEKKFAKLDYRNE